MARKYSTERDLGKSNSSALCNLEKILVGREEGSIEMIFEYLFFNNGIFKKVLIIAT